MPTGNPQPLLNTCPSCQEIIDVSGVRPYEKIHCPLCGDTIRVRTIFNHFTLKAEIGEGGMSRVFRAVDNNLGREVALKILHNRSEDFPNLASQFDREAKITASINHPNVVKVYSVGQDQGYYYIAMELLPSQSLEQLITERGRIPEAEALRIIHEIALGLSAAFQHSLIHRDVKPANILLDHDGSAKLVDFGLALMQGSDEDPMADVWATPFYVPPEKLWNRPEDFRSDIYSLGATLYHMIAGRPPHCAETDSIQELITIKSQPLDLRAGAAHMHDGTLQLISRMMAYDPPARYASYEELLAAIEALRRKVDPGASATGVPFWAKAGAALAAIAAIAGLAMLLSNFLQPSPPSTSSAVPPPRSSAPVVLSSEDSHLADLLPRAREALATNDLTQALPLLQELAANERARADWRTWAAFHLGIESLFQGELDSSRASFLQAADLSKTLSQDLADFIAELAEVFKSDQPPPPPKDGSSALIYLRSLAFGLRSWQTDDYPNAGAHLSRFLLAQFTGNYAWAAAYRSRAESVHADVPLMASLPTRSANGDLQELTEYLEWLASIHKQLHQERSKQAVAKLVAATEKRIAELMEAERAASSNMALAADYALIRDARRASLEKGAVRHFAEAASLWRSAAWQTDTGKQVASRHAEACEQANRFLELFSAAISNYSYEGDILRTEGRAFTARVVGATPDTLMVDLGFGSTPLKMDTISNQGLLNIAQSTVLQSAGPELGQAACFFFWFAGFEAHARRLAESLQSASAFPERWEAVTRPVPEP